MNPISIPEYHPTWEEFENFNFYIERSELDSNAISAGAVKVIKYHMLSV